jgi:hypothetical protein
MRPRPRQVVRRSGIAADLAAHVPSAPRAWPSGIAGVSARVVVTIMRVRFRVGREGA